MLPSALARQMGRGANGTGYHNKKPIMLKKKWHREIWSELLRLLPGPAKAVIIAVVVVPKLVPSMRGYALSMVTTPIPISGVMVDVNTELL